jgi:hypothetical protein
VAEADDAAFLQYHSAVEAAKLCPTVLLSGLSMGGLRVPESQDEWNRITAAIDEKAGTDLSTGLRLSLIDQARNETSDTVLKWGCRDERVTTLLQLYRTDLEPALAG